MIAKMPYQGLNHSLAHLRKQVIAGIPYAIESLPKFSTPEEIFKYFKRRTKYKSDPKNIELFMTLPTFLDNNFWGETGNGDCDDFTIATLTTLLANGFYNSGIVLVGRNKINAVHIYSYCDFKGKRYFLDLTNRYFDYERNYNYRQEIPIELSNNEKQKIKNMQLQLADNGAFNRSNIANHIFVPSKGIYLREDLMDNVPFSEWTQGLSAEGYSNDQIAELSGKRAERKAQKSDTKQTKKATHRAAKDQKKQTRTESKQRMSGEQKSGIAKSLIKIGGGVVSKYTGAEIDTSDTPSAAKEIDKPKSGSEQEDSEKILGMPKMVAYGLGVLAIGTIIVVATKKSK